MQCEQREPKTLQVFFSLANHRNLLITAVVFPLIFAGMVQAIIHIFSSDALLHVFVAVECKEQVFLAYKCWHLLQGPPRKHTARH